MVGACVRACVRDDVADYDETNNKNKNKNQNKKNIVNNIQYTIHDFKDSRKCTRMNNFCVCSNVVGITRRKRFSGTSTASGGVFVSGDEHHHCCCCVVFNAADVLCLMRALQVRLM